MKSETSLKHEFNTDLLTASEKSLKELTVGESQVVKQIASLFVYKMQHFFSQGNFCNSVSQLDKMFDTVEMMLAYTDYGRPMKPFFIENPNFWAWADNLGR